MPLCLHTVIFHHNYKKKKERVQLLHHRFKVFPITQPIFLIYGKVCFFGLTDLEQSVCWRIVEHFLDKLDVLFLLWAKEALTQDLDAVVQGDDGESWTELKQVLYNLWSDHQLIFGVFLQKKYNWLENYQALLWWIALLHIFSQSFKLNCWNSHFYSFLHAWMSLMFGAISRSRMHESKWNQL